jgi:alpha-L-fucosidase 2
LYAVFPFRLFGVGKPELETGRLTFEKRTVKGNNGWRQDDTQAAMLGMTQVAADYIVERAKTKHEESRFPAFWGPNMDWIPDQDHGGNLMMALQTMLMQCKQTIESCCFQHGPKTGMLTSNSMPRSRHRR